MEKIIFTHVSPLAVQGIRRAYAASGAVVRALMGPSGEATVVVLDGEDGPAKPPRKSVPTPEAEIPAVAPTKVG